MMKEYAYSFVLLLATFLMLFVAYLAFRKRQLPVARYCSFMMLAASFYSFGYAFELMSGSMNMIRFWLRIEYIGIPFISTFWLMVVLHYTGRQAVLSMRGLRLLMIIPLITFLMHYTNDLHHLFYRDIHLSTGGLLQEKAVSYKGPWYWVHIAYNYGQAAVGMILFLQMYVNVVPVVRKQIILLMLGAAAPWLFNVGYLLLPLPIEVDLTPLGFAFSGFFYIWGIYRFNLLRLVPVAMQTVFQTMEDGVILLDYELTILNANKAAREIFGDSRLLGRTVQTALADWPELSAWIREPGNGRMNVTHTRKEDIRHYEARLSDLSDKGGSMIGKMLILHDVTQDVRNQEKLRIQAKQVEEFSIFKDRLFTVIAHDIRDPLAMLVSAAELLEEDLADVPDKDIGLLREVFGQVRSTHSLVEHLLEWFRSQRDSPLFHPESWNLAERVNQAVASVLARGQSKQVSVHSEIGGDLVVRADKEMLDVILRNLLSNAIKFTDRGGAVVVEAERQEEWVTVSVRDTGIGIEEEEGRTLFYHIQPGSAGSEGEKGAGLGLYLAEKFVATHGGSIWFRSSPGQGSTFSFTIPAHRSLE